MGLQIGKTSLSTPDRIDFFKTMAGWLDAGAGRVSVAEAVKNTCEAFSHDEYATLKPAMDTIKQAVEDAQSSFYQALADSRLGFEAQELAIIEAAEKSNQLRNAVPSLVAAMEVQYKGRRSLITKLAGPLAISFLLILMSLGVLIFMLPMVVGPVIERNAKALANFPFILRWYWHASVWLRANPGIPIIVLLTPIVLFFIRNTALVKPIMQRFLINWGPSRRLILGFNAMLVAFFMPALLRSGLPSYRVLYNLADCIRNPILSSQFRYAGQDHESGIRLSEALSGIPFKASFLNAVSSGEITGAVADRVQDLQEPYAIELERSITRVVGILKGLVMMVLLPFFIITTYTALVGPIFALMEYS
ncbi:MAG TPA: type II secretion system F family protein [Alphaproteobacteria bacterium]|nr:type II secretion system F family protein [Alphaproteobacteria bacterium]